MQTIEYQRAESVEEAIEIKESAEGNAMYLAGGQSLVNIIKQDLIPEGSLVVDIGHIEPLDFIDLNSKEIRIGALTTHAKIARHPGIESIYPGFTELVSEIADRQVRNMGTIGGNIAHADPRADYPVGLTALGASITVEGVSGHREIGADEFFLGFYESEIDPDEIVREITIPRHDDSTTFAFKKFSQRKGDFPIVNVAVFLDVDEYHITDEKVWVGCVAGKPTPLESLEEQLNCEDVRTFDRTRLTYDIEEDVEIIDGGEFDPEYIAHVSNHLVMEAVFQAIERITPNEDAAKA